MKNMNLKPVLKFGVMFLLLILGTTNCERKDPPTDVLQVQEEPTALQKFPNIKTITYSGVPEMFNRLKQHYKLTPYIEELANNSTLKSGSKKGDAVVLHPEIIKEITVDNYTSFTLRLTVPDAPDNKLYNLTVENNNGEEGMFLTIYTFAQTSSTGKSTSLGALQGISTKRIDDFTTEGEDMFGEINESPAGGGTSGSYSSSEYPTDCNGMVFSTTIAVPYACGCTPKHMPGDACDCQNQPGYNYETTYECVGNSTYDDTDYNEFPSGTRGGGGSSTTVPSRPSVTTMIDADAANSYLESILHLSSDEIAFLSSKGNENIAVALVAFLVGEGNTEEAKTEAQMRLDVKRLIKNQNPRLQYKENKGVYKNREALSYTHSARDLRTGDVYYKLNNGLHLLVSANGSKISDDVRWTSDFPAEGYHYIYDEKTGNYYEYRLPPANYTDGDINFLLRAFWKGVATTARYATPLEDGMILIDGKDFDGELSSRGVAGAMILVSIVPGGKLFKPITKIAKGNKAWKIVMKIADRTVVKTADEIFVALKTEKNTAFFWSGKTNGIGGEVRALEIANSYGGTTLEKTLKSNGITLPTISKETSEIWRQTSEEYAKKASGKVRVVLGQNINPSGVWVTVELPTLKKNPNVTEIIAIDPETLLERLIFKR